MIYWVTQWLRNLIQKPKTKKAVSWWIIYRGIKIMSLYLVFREHPVIWVPTVLTTSAGFYLHFKWYWANKKASRQIEEIENIENTENE